MGGEVEHETGEMVVLEVEALEEPSTFAFADPAALQRRDRAVRGVVEDGGDGVEQAPGGRDGTVGDPHGVVGRDG